MLRFSVLVKVIEVRTDVPRANFCCIVFSSTPPVTEITTAVKDIIKDVKAGKLDPDDIDDSVFESYLNTSTIPDPELLIRTSGEKRISNFMLWQLAYTELYFTPVLWPDFRKDDLRAAIEEFGNRSRRFGGL